MAQHKAVEGLAARTVALDLLAGVLRDKRPLSDLEQHERITQTDPSDRARGGRLARSVLRHGTRADAALRPFLKSPVSPPIRDVLRLATVELLGEGEAPHGVVNAAVTLARKRQSRASALVNAVLRRVAEGGAEAWAKAPPQRLPNWLRGRLGAAYGNKRVAAMEALFAEAPPLDLTPKGDPAALAAALGGTCYGSTVRLRPQGAVSGLPGFSEGDWWVQDAGAALAAQILAPAPGERVLDLCAAPGGKTLQLAAMGAQVTALDLSETRLARLHENLARTGLCAEVIAADALDWTPDAPFDAILLDAPCSATGTLRRHPDLPYVRDGSGLKDLIAVQAALLDRAVTWLRPGGRLVFVTCSLLPEEGEAQFAAFLDRHPDMETAPISGPPEFQTAPGQLRITPDLWADRGGIDGFFIGAARFMNRIKET